MIRSNRKRFSKNSINGFKAISTYSIGPEKTKTLFTLKAMMICRWLLVPWMYVNLKVPTEPEPYRKSDADSE